MNKTKHRQRDAQVQYDTVCADSLNEYRRCEAELRKVATEPGSYQMAELILWREHMDRIWIATRILRDAVPEWFYSVGD